MIHNMRKAEDYKKLIKGYGFGLSVLKQISPEAYKRFLKTREMLNNDNARFFKLMRDLTYDFVNENDESEGESEIIEQKNLLYSEFNAISYSPKYEYELGLLYMKITPFGFKKVFYDISSSTIDDIKENNSVELFGITTLDEANEMDKSFVYVGEIEKEYLIIYEVDLDNPKDYTRNFQIELSKLSETDPAITNMF